TLSPTRKNRETWDDSSWRQTWPLASAKAYRLEPTDCFAVMLERRAVSSFGVVGRDVEGRVSAPNLAADCAGAALAATGAVVAARATAAVDAVGAELAATVPLSLSICAS